MFLRSIASLPRVASALLCAASLFSVSASQAIVLDYGALFDTDNCETGLCSANNPINQDVGDTDAVDFIYQDLYAEAQTGQPASLRFFDLGFNELQGVIFSGVGDGPGQSNGRISLLANDGYEVRLNSITLGALFDGLTTNLSITDAGSNAVLYSEDDLAVGVNDLSLTLMPMGLPSSTSGFIIDWSDTSYNIGIGFLDYDAVATGSVPEPSVALLLGIGVAGATLVRRRRSHRSLR